jgi:hypothetical protein
MQGRVERQRLGDGEREEEGAWKRDILLKETSSRDLVTIYVYVPPLAQH